MWMVVFFSVDVDCSTVDVVGCYDFPSSCCPLDFLDTRG